MTLMTTHRNYQPGQLANAKNGVPLHPQAQGMAGGMTYRPPVREAAEASEVHTLAPEGSTPSPATDDTIELRRICPTPTKTGEECRGYPTATGFCVGHSKGMTDGE